MNDRIRELDVFLRVTEQNSFSAAARSLDCNPSTISKLIQRLEDRLGVRLFHRTSRVLKLTREGEVLLEGAHRVIDALEEAETGLQQVGLEASGVLRLNSSLVIAQYQIAPIVTEFLKRHPKMRVEFILTSTPIDLFENSIDLSFQSGNIPDSSLVAKRIATTKWSICAAPKYLAKAGTPTTVQDLSSHNCLGLVPGRAVATWPIRAGGDRDSIEVEGNISSNSAQLLRTFAVNGAGIVWLSDMLVGGDIQEGRLVRLMEGLSGSQEEPLYVLYPSKRNLSSRVRAFLDFLDEKFDVGTPMER
jgi:DNA-binding transcriptional LysR family regulator